MSKSKINPKHQEFIQEYIINGFNGTDAYRKVYPNSKTPEVNASQLLTNPKVAAAIKKHQAESQKKFKITQEDIVQKLADIAFFDPMSVLEFDEKGRLIYKKEAMSLAGTNFTIYPEYQTKQDIKDNTLRAKLSISSGDRKGALELLGKHIGLWKDKDAGHGTDKESRTAIIRRVQELYNKRKK